MGRRCRFVREQRHVCGDNYMEIDLYPISEREKGASLSAKRRQASSRIQQNLNARNARRYFIQLLNANFTESDIHWTGTYDDAHLPDSIEQADHDLELFLRRVRSQSRKRGLPAPRFIAVTEWREEGDGLPAVRVHHHVVLSCGLSRDELECALPGFVDSKNEEKTERNAGYLVVSHSGGGMLRQGTREGIRRTPANRGMRAHRVVKGLDISEDVCHGLCP